MIVSMAKRFLGPDRLDHLRCLLDRHGRKSYSQEGEDMILDRFLEGTVSGFYVDVGAHHPMRFSNTNFFYRRGWRGINIDAMPGSMKLFDRFRSRDINLECGVAEHRGTLAYHRFNEPALNTFDPLEAKRKNVSPYHLIDIVEVSVERLDTLLDRHLPPNQGIDFLNIDVEGLDEAVVRSNDWSSFRPRIILVETLRTNIPQLGNCPVTRLLDQHGYWPVAKTHNTTFFMCDVS